MTAPSLLATAPLRRPSPPPRSRPKIVSSADPPGALVRPRVTRPPALEPPAVPVFRRPEPTSHAIVFPELPFPPDPASAPGPRFAVAEPDPFTPAMTSRSALPDPARHARRLVQAALEALGGRRPVQQLMPHLTEAAYQRLTNRLELARLNMVGGPVAGPSVGSMATLTTSPTTRPVRDAPPFRAAVNATSGVGPGPRARGTAVPRGDRHGVGRTRIHVGRAIICEPADGIAEATVLARWDGRTRAVAVRLEGIDGRWRCPVLAIL